MHNLTNKQIDNSTLTLFLTMYVVLSSLMVSLSFESDIYRSIAIWCKQMSGGLVQTTLLNYIPFFIIVFVGVIIKFGKLRPSQVGLKANHLLPASYAVVSIWFVMQVVALVSTLVVNSPLQFHNQWYKAGILPVVGAILAQLLGNALFEEIAFRGFLFPQIYLKLVDSKSRFQVKYVVLSILISQLCFSLIHIPIRVYNGITGVPLTIDLILTMVVGIFFCILYIRTSNLFLCVGVHTLINGGTMMFESPIEEIVSVGLLSVLLVIFWSKLRWLHVRERNL